MELDNIAAYWDLRAEGYSQSIRQEMESGRARKFRALLEAAVPDMLCADALDIGCGPGLFTLLLHDMGLNVTSADYSPEMLHRAEENCALAGFRANTVRADAQNLPFADGSFDFVCSRNLVWNLEHPHRAYAEWLRVLRPGGVLFVADGNYYLHYYNKDYQNAREAAAAAGEPGEHSTAGVDPTPINEIARGLPLSRKLRPEWDEECLTGLGLRLQNVRREWFSFSDPDTGEEKRLTRSFVLWGEKQ